MVRGHPADATVTEATFCPHSPQLLPVHISDPGKAGSPSRASAMRQYDMRSNLSAKPLSRGVSAASIYISGYEFLTKSLVTILLVTIPHHPTLGAITSLQLPVQLNFSALYSTALRVQTSAPHIAEPTWPADYTTQVCVIAALSGTSHVLCRD
jgi:hypothetical protein